MIYNYVKVWLCCVVRKGARIGLRRVKAPFLPQGLKVGEKHTQNLFWKKKYWRGAKHRIAPFMVLNKHKVVVFHSF